MIRLQRRPHRNVELSAPQGSGTPPVSDTGGQNQPSVNKPTNGSLSNNHTPAPGSSERSGNPSGPRMHRKGSNNDPLMNQTPQDANGRYGENTMNGDHGENAMQGEHGDNALSGNDGHNALEGAEHPGDGVDGSINDDENGVDKNGKNQDPESKTPSKDEMDNPTSLNKAEQEAKASNDPDNGKKQNPDGSNDKGDGNNPDNDDDQDDKKKQLIKRAMKHAAAKPAEQAGKTMFDLALADSAKRAIVRQLKSDYYNSWWGQALQGVKKAGSAVWDAAKGAVKSIGSHVGKFFHWAGSKLGVISSHLAHFATHIGSQMMANTMLTGMLTLGAGGAVIGGAGYGVYLLMQPQKFAESTACTTQPMSVNQQAALTGNTTGSASTAGMNTDNIKKTWDYLVQHEGFSGAAAAGACGNEAQESGGNPTIANPDSPVVGIFQWGSGGENGARFYNGGFCKPGDPSTWTLDNELKLTDWELHHSFGSWTAKYLNSSDPTEAAHDWCDVFEGASGQAEGQREAYARQFFQQWGGSGVKANPSAFGTAASGDAIAGANDATNQALAAADCGNGKNSDGDRPADGTGAIKENPAGGFQSYAWNNIPADMKQYVPDPTKVGMSFGSSNGWSLPGGQCVDFSVSYFHAIWKNAPKWVSGNGGDIAGNEAKAMGGSTSNTPHAGAVASVPGNSPASVAPGPWGHTFVVVHVLANGDIILLQENFTNSGDNVGKENTWEVGLCSKQLYQQYHWQFWTPQGSPNFG